MTEQFITPEGLKKLKQELKELKDIKRPALIQRIQNAKELGDLSENADYQSAKEEQSFMEGRIMELENIIKNATVITKKKSNGKVRIGSKVKIKSKNKEFEYIITGSNEADPLEGKISNESPLGQAIMDRKVGEEFSIETPKGKVKYKILKIS